VPVVDHRGRRFRSKLLMLWLCTEGWQFTTQKTKGLIK